MPIGKLSRARERLHRMASSDSASGLLLLACAAAAICWANSPWRAAYHSLLAVEVGPSALHLHLSLAQWAADGLLAVFFFVVGTELTHEFAVGSLRDLRLAGAPIGAAVGGVLTPALIYAVIVALAPTSDAAALHGWAIPTATDIAFALAVLAIFGRGLPPALRTFVLTLAVVDDLLGISVIATVYTDSINVVLLGAALVGVGVFALAVRMRRAHWWLLIPIACCTWAAMHASGVHATVAGVLLGVVVPARTVGDEQRARTESLGAALQPLSAAIALPLFAFAAAGVSVIGSSGGLLQPVSVAIVAGLVVGKFLGVMGATALMTRWTPLRLPDGIGLRELVPIAMLTGVGFTVALLIAELSFEEPDDPHAAAAKAAILIGSIIAAVIAAVLLRRDVRAARQHNPGTRNA